MAQYLAEEQREIAILFAEGVALKTGVLELLDHLDRIGLPRAIASSSSRASVREHLVPRHIRSV